MGQTIFGAVALKRGIPVYIMKKFGFKEMLEAVQKYKITTLTMVPPVVVVSNSLLLEIHFYTKQKDFLVTREVSSHKTVRSQQCYRYWIWRSTIKW